MGKTLVVIREVCGVLVSGKAGDVGGGAVTSREDVDRSLDDSDL